MEINMRFIRRTHIEPHCYHR